MLFKKSLKIFAPVNGKIVNLKDVKDEAFSQKLLGDGIAIEPTDGEVLSPIDGKIEIFFETKHAFVIKSNSGFSFLVHIGLDTVKLKGEGFEAFIKEKDEVKKGQKLIQFNIDKIKSKGLESTVIITIQGENEYKNLIYCKSEEVKASKSTILELNY